MWSLDSQASNARASTHGLTWTWFCGSLPPKLPRNHSTQTWCIAYFVLSYVATSIPSSSSLAVETLAGHSGWGWPGGGRCFKKKLSYMILMPVLFCCCCSSCRTFLAAAGTGVDEERERDHSQAGVALTTTTKVRVPESTSERQEYRKSRSQPRQVGYKFYKKPSEFKIGFQGRRGPQGIQVLP